MDDREQALTEIVDLARRHGLTASDIASALGTALAAGGDRESRSRSVLVSVLGFLGGTFVFAGIGVFIAVQWDSLNSAARVIVTLGPGVVALVLAVISTREIRFSKATTPLFLVAAA